MKDASTVALELLNLTTDLLQADLLNVLAGHLSAVDTAGFAATHVRVAAAHLPEGREGIEAVGAVVSDEAMILGSSGRLQGQVGKGRSELVPKALHNLLELADLLLFLLDAIAISSVGLAMVLLARHVAVPDGFACGAVLELDTSTAVTYATRGTKQSTVRGRRLIDIVHYFLKWSLS